jgi:hypothetical protein
LSQDSHVESQISSDIDFVVNSDTPDNYEMLRKKTQLRISTYERYKEYYLKHIPNECISPLDDKTLKNIVKGIKNLVRNLGRTHGKIVFDRLLNEVNQHYFVSGKKAILDYILKDES